MIHALFQKIAREYLREMIVKEYCPSLTFSGAWRVNDAPWWPQVLNGAHRPTDEWRQRRAAASISKSHFWAPFIIIWTESGASAKAIQWSVTRMLVENNKSKTRPEFDNTNGAQRFSSLSIHVIHELFAWLWTTFIWAALCVKPTSPGSNCHFRRLICLRTHD